jgi:hypothetical protein
VNPRRTLVLAPVAAVVALAAAPGAQAATVSTTVPCVRVLPGIQSFPVVADGFAPGAFLSFRADDQTIGSGSADAAGHFQSAFSPPDLPFGRDLKTFQLTADDGNGTVAGPVAVPVSNVVVRAPANSKPTKRVRFRVFGFLENQRVYLHVRRNGKTKGRFSLGKTSAPCGTTSKKLRFMPLRHYSFGTYRYYFSHSRRFDKKKAIYSARVRIYRTFSSSASRAHTTAAGVWG